MSTRGFVGAVESAEPGARFRARGVEYTCDPEHMGSVLGEILVWLDGDVEALVQILIHDHYGWAELNASQTDALFMGGSPIYAVPGVGVAYSDCEQTDWINGLLDGPLELPCSLEWGFLFCVETEQLIVVRVVRGCALIVGRFDRSFVESSSPVSWAPYRTLAR